MRNRNILKDDCVKHIVGDPDSQKNNEENDMAHLFRLWLQYGDEVNEIKKYLNKLEIAVTLIEVDYVDILGHVYQGNRNNRIFEQCYDIYVTLDSLANDLKNVRMSLDNSTGYYKFMKRFESFSRRFANAANRICNEIDNHELMYDYNQGFNDE